MRIISKRYYKLSKKRFILGWLLCPIASLVDALVTLLVYPFGYNSEVYDNYLEYSLTTLYSEERDRE